MVVVPGVEQGGHFIVTANVSDLNAATRPARAADDSPRSATTAATSCGTTHASAAATTPANAQWRACHAGEFGIGTTLLSVCMHGVGVSALWT